MCFGLTWVILYNPFFLLVSSQKFPLVTMIWGGLCGILGLLLLKRRPQIHLGQKYWILLILFVIMLLRMNDINDFFGSVLSTMQIQMTLMIILSFCAYLLYMVYGYEQYITSISIPIILSALYIGLNPGVILGDVVLGQFTADSYQSISLVLGLGIIFGFFRIFSTPNILIKLIILVVCAWFFYLVLQNRARGEFFALIIAISSAYFPKLSILAGTVMVLNLTILKSIIISLDIPVINRIMASLEVGNFGTRDELYQNSIDLIFSDTSVFFVGGGANYFQAFYGYYASNYPHNVFLEGWVSGGLLFFIALLYFLGRPIVAGYSKVLRSRPISKESLAICIFIVIIFLKSGTLVSAWPIGFFLPLYHHISSN